LAARPNDDPGGVLELRAPVLKTAPPEFRRLVVADPDVDRPRNNRRRTTVMTAAKDAARSRTGSRSTRTLTVARGGA
jgi:hypothetical protein